MTSPGYNGAGTGSLLAGNGTLTQSVVQLSDSGNTPTNHGVMHASQILLDSNTNPGSQSVNQIAGDGIVEEANDISTGLGCSPVKIISVAKAGQSSNSWGLDYLPVTYPLTNTAGTFSMPAWASQTAGGWATALNTVGTGVEFVSTAATIPTSANTGAGPQLTMLVGSLQIKDSLGTLLATDANCTPGTDPCTLSYAGVTAGTVNHLTGVIAGLTFSVTPTNLPVSATWTNISDTLAGQYTQQSTYVGFPTWGNGTSITSGYGTAVLLNQVQPVSANVFEQCTADSGTMTGTTPPATNNANYQLSWATMWNNTFYTKIASLPFWRAGTPTLVLGYGRDAGAAPGSVSKCRQALRVLGSGPPSGVTGGPYAFLGDYYDDVTQLSGSVYLGIGPHEGPWLHGGRRMARRAAAMMVAYQTQNFTKASEPQIICAQAAAGCYTTGTAPVRAPAGGGPLTTCGTNCIEFTVYMPNSGALTNCGTNLSGSGAGNITGGTGGVSSTSLVVSASTGPNLVPGMIITGTGTNSGGAVVGSADTNLGTTGTFTLSVAQTIANGTALSAIPGGACTPPGTPVGTAVYGFRFGTAASTVYNYNGWTGSGNLVDANQTSCVISSATTVDCTGTLISSGNIYWTYADDAPLSDAGTEKPLTVTGGTGYGVNAGPTTVTDTTLTGAINASASPGTCTHPTVSMTTNAAGVVSATRLAPGSVCVGTPTFAIPTSGGAWSGVGVGGSVVGSVFGVADDINHLGQVLYDNTGYCNGVISATTYEPGCPVAPITIPQGPVT
jgi:hypothetical protein